MTARIVFLCALVSPTAYADTTYKCSYSYMGAPMSTIELLVYSDGEPASSALITMGTGTSTHKESVTPEIKAFGELVHIWISKQNPENEVEMIIYETKKTEGSSVIINHKMPIGSHVWGDCTI